LAALLDGYTENVLLYLTFFPWHVHMVGGGFLKLTPTPVYSRWTLV